jgi:hypothetical protein
MGRYAKRQPRPLKEIAIIDPETISQIAAEIPPSGLTLSQVKSDTDIADSLSKKHSSGSDNQDLSGLQPKETGKGLSTNDLTSALKTNYDNAYTHSQAAHLQFTGLAKITVGTNQPSNPSVGDLWVDIN